MQLQINAMAIMCNSVYLQLQLQDLLLQFPHFCLFSVSGCLSCHSVLEFPGKKNKEGVGEKLVSTMLTKPSDMTLSSQHCAITGHVPATQAKHDINVLLCNSRAGRVHQHLNPSHTFDQLA